MPDIEIIISSWDFGSVSSLAEFANMVKNNRAISVTNSTFERNILELQKDYFPEKKIKDQREYLSYLRKSLNRMNSLVAKILEIKFSNHNTEVHVTLKDENQTIRFEIEDEGPGIMEEDKLKPF